MVTKAGAGRPKASPQQEGRRPQLPDPKTYKTNHKLVPTRGPSHHHSCKRSAGHMHACALRASRCMRARAPKERYRSPEFVPAPHPPSVQHVPPPQSLSRHVTRVLRRELGRDGWRICSLVLLVTCEKKNCTEKSPFLKKRQAPPSEPLNHMAGRQSEKTLHSMV